MTSYSERVYGKPTQVLIAAAEQRQYGQVEEKSAQIIAAFNAQDAEEQPVVPNEGKLGQACLPIIGFYAILCGLCGAGTIAIATQNPRLWQDISQVISRLP